VNDEIIYMKYIISSFTDSPRISFHHSNKCWFIISNVLKKGIELKQAEFQAAVILIGVLKTQLLKRENMLTPSQFAKTSQIWLRKKAFLVNEFNLLLASGIVSFEVSFEQLPSVLVSK